MAYDDCGPDFDDYYADQYDRDREDDDMLFDEALDTDEDCEDKDIFGDGQPSEYDEWQDYMGGDDWDHGQYDDPYGDY